MPVILKAHDTSNTALHSSHIFDCQTGQSINPLKLIITILIAIMIPYLIPIALSLSIIPLNVVLINAELLSLTLWIKMLSLALDAL